MQFLRAARTPGQLADLAGYSPDLTIDQKVQVLETLDVESRLRMLIDWMRGILAEASLKEKIRSEVNEGMEKTQREFLLRQQLEAIRKELGDSGDDVVGGYRKRIDEAGMPEKVRTEVERELGRLERTSEQNPEHGWIRTYLDWMLDIPWNVRSDDNYDLNEARRILDEDHTGLDDVKSRIIEFLAVRKLRQERGLSVLGGRGSGAIITLVGPPGVGKTSLGESVARALGRKFARVSLGGIHDEAEIRGHRRTYVGAHAGTHRARAQGGRHEEPGDHARRDRQGRQRLARRSRRRRCSRCSTRRRTTPSATTTSRSTSTSPTSCSSRPPTCGRRSRRRCSTGWSSSSSTATRSTRSSRSPATTCCRGRSRRPACARRRSTVGEDAIDAVITGYTREAGVRNLERELGKMARKIATAFATGELQPPVAVTPEMVTRFLGTIRFDNEVAERTAVPGVATGLAVTGVGGDVLFVEATSVGEKGSLTLTGQLGDVMKESAQIALSYVRSHAAELGIDPERANKGFHLHVPEGAVPKDGPSAGVTMTTAIVSLLTDRPVRNTVGMTGEVTLQGLVLPDRRRQAEGPRGTSHGAQGGDPAGAQRQGSR